MAQRPLPKQALVIKVLGQLRVQFCMRVGRHCSHTSGALEPGAAAKLRQQLITYKPIDRVRKEVTFPDQVLAAGGIWRNWGKNSTVGFYVVGRCGL